MAGRTGASRSGVVTLCLLLASVLLSLVACGGGAPADGAKADVQRLLDRRSDALLGHDSAAFARTGTDTEFRNLAAVPLASWSYRLNRLHRTGDTATADAELSYKVKDYDTAPVTAARSLSLSLTADGRWYVDADRPARKSAEQLWDQGKVIAVRGRHSLVLGVGDTSGLLHTYADLADHAVPAVSRAWGTHWTRHVVVLVPDSLQAMADLLGSPASSYRGIAAVTTGEAGGTGKAPADRIIVNPDAYALLGSVGKQVVLTHETTHVATRAHTTPATPLWLSEGYADWIGYLGTGRTVPEAAPELWRSLQDGHVPDALPADKDFAFNGDATRLAEAYESGWLACRLIADHWGQAALRDFYSAVGDHRQRPGAVEDAMKRVLDTTPEQFTAEWREYLRAL